MVYLLHFEDEIGSGVHGRARHYLGFTDDLPSRLELHRKGQAATLTRAFAKNGIDFVLARTWPGNRKTERRLKNRKNSPRLCPICQSERKK